jgi:hypothetical protein
MPLELSSLTHPGSSEGLERGYFELKLQALLKAS